MSLLLLDTHLLLWGVHRPERLSNAARTRIGAHAAAVASLPPLHKDPFDRILVAQARMEGAVLLTAEAAMARYGEPVAFVG